MNEKKYVLEGILQRFDVKNSGRVYPAEEQADGRGNRYINEPAITHKAVTLMSGGLYVRLGAEHHEIMSGYEYFAVNGDNSRIKINALNSMIQKLIDKIKLEHL